MKNQKQKKKQGVRQKEKKGVVDEKNAPGNKYLVGHTRWRSPGSKWAFGRGGQLTGRATEVWMWRRKRKSEKAFRSRREDGVYFKIESK